MSQSLKARAHRLAVRTADAYSVRRYGSWEACCAALLRRGYTMRAAEAILRSKVPRWAADASGKRDGRASARDLIAFIDRAQGDTRAVIAELATG